MAKIVDKKKLSELQHVSDLLLEFEDSGDIYDVYVYDVYVYDVYVVPGIRISFKVSECVIGYNKAIFYQNIINKLKRKFKYVRLDNNSNIHIDEINIGDRYYQYYDIPDLITKYVEKNVFYNTIETRSILFQRKFYTYTNGPLNLAFYSKKSKALSISTDVYHMFFSVKKYSDNYFINMLNMLDMWFILGEYLKQLFNLDIKEICGSKYVDIEEICSNKYNTTKYKININKKPVIKYFL